MIGRCAAGIFAAQKCLTRILTDIHTGRPLNTVGSRGTLLVGVAFVRNRMTATDQIVRPSGMALLTLTRYKMFIGTAECFWTANINGTAVHTEPYTVLVQMTDLSRATVSVGCAVIFWRTAPCQIFRIARKAGRTLARCGMIVHHTAGIRSTVY